MPDKDELDVLLDSALASYADPGTEVGLERRVLAALEATRCGGERRFFAKTRTWLPWAVGVPVAASLLFWMAISRLQYMPAAKTQQAYERERVQAPAIHPLATTARADSHPTVHPSGAKAHRDIAVVAARLKSCPVTERDSAARIAVTSTSCMPGTRDVPGEAQVAMEVPRPKLDVFPTPQPLTDEEQALAAAARSGFKAERDALAARSEPADTALGIAALDIPPLAVAEEAKK